MKNYKRGIISMSIILMLSLICLNSTFAFEINDDLNLPDGDTNENLNVPDGNINDDLNLQNEDDLLSEDAKTFAMLNEDINGNSDEEINLTSDYTFNNQTDKQDAGLLIRGITISRNLTINGNGHTLDGSDVARFFLITDSSLNVVFKDLIFINGHAHDGGAISGNSISYNCTFINNRAQFFGGAIYKGSAVNCTFEGNNASEGGAIYVNTNHAVIEDCTFEWNIADESGGAISIDSTVNTTLANCTFHKNRAKTGGAISLSYSRYASISNSTFNENNVTENGVAIYSDFAVNCLIDN